MEDRRGMIPRPAWHEEPVEEPGIVQQAYSLVTDRATAINIRREELRKELNELDKEYTQVNEAAMALLEVLNP